MADRELIITVPEELYEVYKGRPPILGGAGMDMIAQSIANGIPLPKEHGDLIDRQALINNGIEKGFCDWYDEIKYADAIIKARHPIPEKEKSKEEDDYER